MRWPIIKQLVFGGNIEKQILGYKINRYEADLEGDGKNLTACSTSQNKKKFICMRVVFLKLKGLHV